MKEQDWEREHLKDSIFIKEAEWLEQEEIYRQEERNKRLPAIIKVLIPKFKSLKS